MNLGNLNEDFCIVCGKAVRSVGGLVMHVELDISHTATLPAGERNIGPVVPGIRTIQVTPDVSLKFDLADGWFGIADADNLGYDEMGAVLMNLADIDALIVALGELRKKVEKNVGSGL